MFWFHRYNNLSLTIYVNFLLLFVVIVELLVYSTQYKFTRLLTFKIKIKFHNIDIVIHKYESMCVSTARASMYVWIYYIFKASPFSSSSLLDSKPVHANEPLHIFLGLVVYLLSVPIVLSSRTTLAKPSSVILLMWSPLRTS